MAADASYAGWPQLAYLDISWNPLFALDPILGTPLTWLLGAPTNVLPAEWETISLSVLRVRNWPLLACTASDLQLSSDLAANLVIHRLLSEVFANTPAPSVNRRAGLQLQ
jgi:hypothetical protein